MTLELSVFLTLASILVGAGIGWGTIRSAQSSSIERLEHVVSKLEALADDVITLKAEQINNQRTIINHADRIRTLELKMATIEALVQN